MCACVLLFVRIPFLGEFPCMRECVSFERAGCTLENQGFFFRTCAEWATTAHVLINCVFLWLWTCMEIMNARHVSPDFFNIFFLGFSCHATQYPKCLSVHIYRWIYIYWLHWIIFMFCLLCIVGFDYQSVTALCKLSRGFFFYFTFVFIFFFHFICVYFEVESYLWVCMRWEYAPAHPGYGIFFH